MEEGRGEMCMNGVMMTPKVVAARGGCVGCCVDEVATSCARDVFGGVRERRVECEGREGFSEEVT